MQAISRAFTSYCPLNSPAKLPAFLFTELQPLEADEQKPSMLTRADAVLDKVRSFSPYNNVAIGYKGMDFESLGISKGKALVDSFIHFLIFVGVNRILGITASNAPLARDARLYFFTSCIMFLAAALLKLYVYHTDVKVRAAYDNYLSKKDFPTSEIALPDFKCTDLVQVAKNNQEKAPILINDIWTKIISYLPTSDSLQFREINKWAFKAIPNEYIIKQKIYKNFSTDFIDSFGLEKLLKLLWGKPLDNQLIPKFDHDYNYFTLPVGVELGFEKRRFFLRFMEKHSIVWSSHKTEKSRELFLCFRDKVDSRMVAEFFLVKAHENSEVFWQDRAVKRLDHYTHQASTIYKVDEDHFSISPDGMNPWETNFYRNFTPKALEG